jgi:hypothetical protein
MRAQNFARVRSRHIPRATLNPRKWPNQAGRNPGGFATLKAYGEQFLESRRMSVF